MTTLLPKSRPISKSTQKIENRFCTTRLARTATAGVVGKISELVSKDFVDEQWSVRTNIFVYAVNVIEVDGLDFSSCIVKLFQLVTMF